MNASLPRRLPHPTLALPLLAIVLLGGCSLSSASREFRTGEDEPRRSTSILTAEEIEKYPSATSVEDLLEQHFKNLYILRRNRNPGASGDIYMHGRQAPLIVIDGIPLEYTGTIGLNPRDVQSIELVKFGESAFYGLRGSSGAIVITTKQR